MDPERLCQRGFCAENGTRWTVASLALEVGMSRTQFAERFKEMIGDGPLGYLTNWRLQRHRLC